MFLLGLCGCSNHVPLKRKTFYHTHTMHVGNVDKAYNHCSVLFTQLLLQHTSEVIVDAELTHGRHTVSKLKTECDATKSVWSHFTSLISSSVFFFVFFSGCLVFQRYRIGYSLWYRTDRGGRLFQMKNALCWCCSDVAGKFSIQLFTKECTALFWSFPAADKHCYLLNTALTQFPVSEALPVQAKYIKYCEFLGLSALPLICTNPLAVYSNSFSVKFTDGQKANSPIKLCFFIAFCIPTQCLCLWYCHY